MHHGCLWKPHVALAVGAAIPLAARLRAANEADDETAPELLEELPVEVRRAA